MKNGIFTQGNDGGIYTNGIKLTVEQINKHVDLEDIEGFNKESYCQCYDLPLKQPVPLDVLIAREFNTTVENLYSGSRSYYNGSLLSRQMYIKMLRDHTDMTVTNIGKLVKTPRSPDGIDHATVSYTCKRVNNDIATNREIRDIYNRIKKKIKNREVIIPEK